MDLKRRNSLSLKADAERSGSRWNPNEQAALTANVNLCNRDPNPETEQSLFLKSVSFVYSVFADTLVIVFVGAGRG